MTPECLLSYGFKGGVRIKDLRNGKLAGIPAVPGVYAVVKLTDDLPAFLRTSTGGKFKEKDPTVSVSDLERKWVDGARVLYIGKAGGAKQNANLKGRIKQYLDFGQGAAVGHWGGRYIWQLKDSAELIICWKTTPRTDPRSVEIALLDKFKKIYGWLPFGNLRK